MAKNAGVWGIDIGQAAFKALRCTLQDGEVVADAFDYIEYPKILSQPEAEPEKMIRDAIGQFLSRNDVASYKIALAVPGQSGLAKFFKPPPVDAKLIPEIVKFEARQQIRLRWTMSSGISSRWVAARSKALRWKRKSACLR